MFWANSFIVFILLWGRAGQGISKKSLSSPSFQLETHHELAEILRHPHGHTFRLMVCFSLYHTRQLVLVHYPHFTNVSYSSLHYE